MAIIKPIDIGIIFVNSRKVNINKIRTMRIITHRTLIFLFGSFSKKGFQVNEPIKKPIIMNVMKVKNVSNRAIKK